MWERDARAPTLTLTGQENMKDPRTMSASEINRALDKLEGWDTLNCNAMIESGLGHETYTDSQRSVHPLSVERCRLARLRFALRDEIDARYGPGAPSRLPLRRGWYGPRASQGSVI